MLIKEVILQTNRLSELKSFYEILLGLEISKSDENSFTVRTPGSDLTFTESEGGKDPFYHFAFNIPENRFREAKQWMKQRTVLIKLHGEDEFDFKSWNAHSVYFYDTAGNIAELIARHNLNNSSDIEFSGKSFLSISEIGMPVRNVGEYFNELNAKLSIPEFSGDRKNFCAAGDDNGLMIIVPEKRIWFPDCGEAEIFPITVKINSDSDGEFHLRDIPYKIISEIKSETGTGLYRD